MVEDIVRFLLTTVAAGAIAGAAMEVVLWFIGAAGWARADMVVALGSLFTKSRDTAWRVGATLHAIAAVTFAMLYALALMSLNMTQLPWSLVIGGAMGFGHGLVVSLGLVWVVAERHPLKEFNEAGMAIGLSHMLGHVVYGGVVGLVVGVSPL